MWQNVVTSGKFFAFYDVKCGTGDNLKYLLEFIFPGILVEERLDLYSDF